MWVVEALVVIQNRKEGEGNASAGVTTVVGVEKWVRNKTEAA